MAFVNIADLRRAPACVNVPAGAGSTAVSAAPGVLRKVVVIAAGTVSTTFYDNTGSSGAVLFTTPATTALGAIYDLDLPAVNGITALGSSGSPQLTVSYL